MREQLLSHLPWFVSAATKLSGIRRVLLLGSITTNKPNPKDIDFLVEVDEETDLEPLARLGRKLKGRAQQMNRGADIFLTNPQGTTSAEPVIGGNVDQENVCHVTR